ncbi:nuclear transport factor 2 family protein [Caenimonas aquaedulcis]|uniref:Nuclear transport factor 2 family protein n=1 Tax=Caenimonas aquaedulcis TaxID=2793270 RepID=A0A931MGI5_9BURK|nr:nuclear transport factor 2 family protein [Caenimonas aquaedulcis]MBG9388068.1 nuclear transport factor 2 family protein [Caenimonas aquaedulcis]
MLPTKEISRIAQERFAAFESGDAARAVALYADEAKYWDTKTPGGVNGKAGLHGHFARFLQAFDVRYALLEEHRLEGRNASIVLWECAVRGRGADGAPGEGLVMQRGMNLFEMSGGLITREESYMDLASLDRLLTPAA